MSKPQGKRRPKQQKEKPEFDQTIVDLARVTRVTTGGKQMSFRALVLIGDRNGRVGFGVEKGSDVQIAVDKAVRHAKKSLITVPFDDVTIPHRVESKFKAGKVMIKPAPQGSGIIAGSSIRLVLELAGVPNASAKMLGKSGNKISNVKATFEALKSFKPQAVQKMMKKKADLRVSNVKKIEIPTIEDEVESNPIVKKVVVSTVKEQKKVKKISEQE
jgi:small subunit ribosomal protein S5